MDKVSWIDSNGTEHPFTNELVVLAGKKGFYMPPIYHVEETVPFQAGTRHKQTIFGARDVDIPLLIQTNSPLTLRQRVRECLRMFKPTEEGTIKVIAPDGTQREIHCRYSGGLEGNDGRDVKGIYWQTIVLVFRAFDPFWYDSQTIVETFRLNESPGLFFPIPPLRLVSSTVFADITINNTGDVETFPEWIITGPGENIVLENMTTGETTELDSSLGIGESITINTKPFYKTVTRNDGLNLYVDLSDNSSLWALQDGINNIRIQMSNATELSSVQLSYKNRYLGV